MGLESANYLIAVIVGIAILLGMLVGFVAWFIRLEAKVAYLEKDHVKSTDHQTANHTVLWAKMDAMQQSQNSILQALGRIDERTRDKNNA